MAQELADATGLYVVAAGGFTADAQENRGVTRGAGGRNSENPRIESLYDFGGGRFNATNCYNSEDNVWYLFTPCQHK